MAIDHARERASSALAFCPLTMSADGFTLGIGTSGAQGVEGWHGIPFKKPLGRMRNTVDICRKVWSGDKVTNDGRAVSLPWPADEGTGPGRGVAGDARRWQALRGAASGPFTVEPENALWEDSEMPTIDLDRARARLVVERERLQRELAEVRGERTTDGPIDTLSGDAAQDTTRVETEMGLEADIEQSLADVTAALRRVDDGSYGYDEETGEPIDPVRLEAVPTARTNIR